MKITTQAQISIILITMLTCFLPLATYAQQSSASASVEAKDVVLLIGEHPGIDEVDAQSAAVLIAVELRKLRIPVSDPIYKAPAKGIVYQVTLRRLGEKILVHLSQETASGTVIVEKQLWIANIEEIIAAAPRLVDALVHNKPIDSTVDMESVTEHEASELNKITGESLWNVGIFGTFIPGTDIAAEPGYEFGWSYETPAYSVGTEFRGSGTVVETTVVETTTILCSYLGQLVDVTSSTKRTFHRMREVDSLYLVEVTIQTNGTTMITVTLI